MTKEDGATCNDGIALTKYEKRKSTKLQAKNNSINNSVNGAKNVDGDDNKSENISEIFRTDDKSRKGEDGRVRKYGSRKKSSKMQAIDSSSNSLVNKVDNDEEKSND